jgi:hypothetical protein
MTVPRIFTNPACGASDDTRVWANLDPSVHHYFFRQVLAGSTGAKQAIINTFFAKFYDACLTAGITNEWSLENEFAVRDVLKKLNFNGTRPTSTRRTTNTAPKRKSKPARSDDVAGATHGVCKEASKLRNVSTDA